MRVSKKPWTMTEVRPTANSDHPFSCGPQPNLKVVNSTQLLCKMNCDRADKPMTTTSTPTPFK